MLRRPFTYPLIRMFILPFLLQDREAAFFALLSPDHSSLRWACENTFISPRVPHHVLAEEIHLIIINKQLFGGPRIIPSSLPSLFRRYCPDVALNQGITWRPTWSALPNYTFSKLGDRPKSPYCFWPAELLVFATTLRFIHSREGIFSPLCLWPPLVRYAFDDRNNILTHQALDLAEETVGPALPTIPEGQSCAFRAGRLGQAVEGRAKRRIFAIGNYVNQRLLRPVHDWLMNLLRRIPTDGTFNQSAPLLRLTGKHCFYCYDLTAATDRFPLRYSYHVMDALFGSAFASSVVNGTLALNTFDIPFVCGKGGRRLNTNSFESYVRDRSIVSFVAGQPLGNPIMRLGLCLLFPIILWCGKRLTVCIQDVSLGITRY